jgi:hypothetical protein
VNLKAGCDAATGGALSHTAVLVISCANLAADGRAVAEGRSSVGATEFFASPAFIRRTSAVKDRSWRGMVLAFVAVS